MSKYDVIYESIIEKVNNEELTLEEAQELNELAFEKYGDTEVEEEESVTLEEAMEIIGGYLIEAKGDSPELKEQKKTVKNLYKEKINNEEKPEGVKNYNSIDDARTRIANSFHNKKNEIKYDQDKIDMSSRKISDFIDNNDKEKKIKKLDEQEKRHLKQFDTKKKVLNNLIKKKKIEQEHSYGDDYFRDKKTGKVYKLGKNLGLKESVNDLRLQVYEAFDAGLIEESTKDLFLTYLDLENYE